MTTFSHIAGVQPFELMELYQVNFLPNGKRNFVSCVLSDQKRAKRVRDAIRLLFSIIRDSENQNFSRVRKVNSIQHPSPYPNHEYMKGYRREGPPQVMFNMFSSFTTRVNKDFGHRCDLFKIIKALYSDDPHLYQYQDRIKQFLRSPLEKPWNLFPLLSRWKHTVLIWWKPCFVNHSHADP